MASIQSTGLPIAEGLNSALDLPHTITFAINYRETINNLRENLPKDKQPPRNLWDKPWRLSQFLDEVWETEGKSKDEVITYDPEEVE